MQSNAIIESIDLGAGYSVNIFVDESAESPREWSTLSILELTHRRYDLPSEGGGLNFELYDDNDNLLDEGWSAAEANIKKLNPVMILPITGYDHGGLSVSVDVRPDMWDGGRLGFIYTTAAKCQELGVDPNDAAAIRQALEAEIKLFNYWLNGEVCGFEVLDPLGRPVDSCFGFYGPYDESGLLDEARAVVARHQKANHGNRLSLMQAANDFQLLIFKLTADNRPLYLKLDRQIKSIKALIDKA